MQNITIIAIGGNQIADVKEKIDLKSQLSQVQKTIDIIAKFINKNPGLFVITHGNGPQVGIRLSRSYFASISKQNIFPETLDICGADTQGAIGFMIQNAFFKYFQDRKNFVSIVTQVLVDEKDNAFKNPTKFIGPGYTIRELKNNLKVNKYIKKGITGEPEYHIEEKKNTLIYRRYKNKIFRRVVPSPKPKEIIEFSVILSLIKNSIIPITCGGGGIPVIKKRNELKGFEAVIDKDFTSALLAKKLVDIKYKVDLIILTNVDSVYLNFGKKDKEYSIPKLSLKNAKQYIKEGHFQAGSMLPKIKAAIFALENNVEKVVITSPNYLEDAVKGIAGTRIIK
jgi:carbamate kinase